MRDLMPLLLRRPEVWDMESLVEIRSEVVHDADGEHDVHAKLCTPYQPTRFQEFFSKKAHVRDEEEVNELTLNTSRFSPPMLEAFRGHRRDFQRCRELKEVDCCTCTISICSGQVII